MNRVTAILIVLFCPIIFFGQAIKPEVRALVDSIAVYNTIDDQYIFSARMLSRQYNRVNKLSEIASTNELMSFLKNNNSTVKCSAFQSLCRQDSVDIIAIVLSHLYDTSTVNIQQGCIGSQVMIGDFFLENFYFYLATKDVNYFTTNHTRIFEIDSIVKYDPAIKLAYKESWIRGIKADTQYYDRVREIAIKERMPVSVLTLARYQKQQDKEIIASYFRDKETQYYAIWAVKEFPDSSFYPLLLQVFEEEWKHKRYDYVKWRVLYQALAKYPCEQTIKLFDKTLHAWSKFRRQTLGRYLTIAVMKYPNPIFEKFTGKVVIDNFHRHFLEEEANVEN